MYCVRVCFSAQFSVKIALNLNLFKKQRKKKEAIHGAYRVYRGTNTSNENNGMSACHYMSYEKIWKIEKQQPGENKNVI